MKKPAEKTVAAAKRSAPQRPVIAMRVHDSIWERLKNSAAANHNSMSAEAERRIDKSFEWDRASQSIERWKSKQEAAIAKDLKAAMIAAGYQQIVTASGRVWTEPGVEFSLEAFEDAIERAVTKAIVQLNRPTK